MTPALVLLAALWCDGHHLTREPAGFDGYFVAVTRGGRRSVWREIPGHGYQVFVNGHPQMVYPGLCSDRR